jgi:FkbM family methyltransferase
MLAKMLVGLWLALYGRFRIRGVGSLIRLACPFVPGLRAYPLEIPEVGTILLDFRESVAFNMLLRFKLGRLGTDVGLYRAMERFCLPDSVLWDIGAYVGYVSVHFAQSRFRLAEIHAFEPNPANLARLNAMFRNSSRVTVHPFALGKTETSMILSFGTRDASVGSLVRECKGGEHVSVLVRHGDTVRRELKIPAPDVIKIDVEGFEPEVIGGLHDTIYEKRPVIFLSIFFCPMLRLRSYFH